MSPETSVVICAYTLDRWNDLQRAVDSARSQRPPLQEVVVVIDHNPELLERAQDLWDGCRSSGDGAARVRVAANRAAKGLSGARNTGIAVASSEIVAFLDDDAEADEDWIARLVAPYADPLVGACGGAALARPVGGRPAWWPTEFDWVVGCSYRGLPTGRATVRNLIGANMSARRSLLLDLGGFAPGIGRVGSRPVGCEETDLFIRLAQRWPEARILYEPAAAVHHTVPSSRFSWSYFLRRCFAEGLSKAIVASRVGAGRALAAERSYTLKVLPLGLARAVGAACRGERGAGQRAVAIAAGLSVTTSGYLWGRVSRATTGTLPAERCTGL